MSKQIGTTTSPTLIKLLRSAHGSSPTLCWFSYMSVFINVYGTAFFFKTWHAWLVKRELPLNCIIWELIKNDLYILEIGRQHLALQNYSDLSLIYMYNHNKPHNRTLGMDYIPDDVYMFKSIKGKILTFFKSIYYKADSMAGIIPH